MFLDCPEILIIKNDVLEIALVNGTLPAANRKVKTLVLCDGEQALDFLFSRNGHSGRDGNHQPKVIFLDTNLPQVSGLEVLRQIRNEPRTCYIPVVIFTASSENGEVKKAYELGANSYIVQPIEPEQFMEIANYWIQYNQFRT